MYLRIFGCCGARILWFLSTRRFMIKFLFFQQCPKCVRVNMVCKVVNMTMPDHDQMPRDTCPETHAQRDTCPDERLQKKSTSNARYPQKLCMKYNKYFKHNPKCFFQLVRVVIIIYKKYISVIQNISSKTLEQHLNV